VQSWLKQPKRSQVLKKSYDAGFITDIEQEFAPVGLDESTVRFISAKKSELEWRLSAFRAWQKMKEPRWANVDYPEIDYQSICLDEVDPKLLETYEKLGIPLHERERLAGVAVDAVFDSVSVATTFKEQAGREGHHLLLLLGGGARAPRAGEEVPRLVVPVHATTSSPR
jgi:Fe-S cluster assembly protein SufB